jgi:uncharacterized FlaG/YvyC family protein
MELSQVAALNRVEAAHLQQQQQQTAVLPDTLAARQEARQKTREVASAVHTLNSADFSGPTRELTIKLDPKTQRPMVRIIDKATGEVVQQIPPEYVLRMAREAKERLRDGSG